MPLSSHVALVPWEMLDRSGMSPNEQGQVGLGLEGGRMVPYTPLTAVEHESHTPTHATDLCGIDKLTPNVTLDWGLNSGPRDCQAGVLPLEPCLPGNGRCPVAWL
jgi:hypothetical protein